VLATAATLPGVLTALVLLLIVDMPPQVRVAIAGFIASTTFLLLAIMRDRVLFPLRTMSNLVGAIREGDFSLRARRESDDDPLGELAFEINRLSRTLREKRLDEAETDGLVRAIVAQLDSAIFTFDHNGRLRLVNHSGARLLAQEPEDLIGKTANDLGLEACLERTFPASVEMRFPGAEGRWAIRRSTFFEKGETHRLLVVDDLSRALRDEELLAWQRLVRVIGHELNNSLAPIKAVATGLRTILERNPLPHDWREDADSCLEIISGRAEALTRFTRAYARLARLPKPVLAPVSIAAVARRVAALSFGVPIEIEQCADVIVLCDEDQIEQVLINLIQNAAEASAETGGSVRMAWQVRDGDVELRVIDSGHGLAGTPNLFVPFFTTKPGGTGIGLVLGRQIAEAHGGKLSLHARGDRPGCEARLLLRRTGSE
jgi:two-component system nitrogen regulation sensor histidine kinase NtrY